MINKKAIRKNIGAHGFFLLFNSVYQVILIPILLSNWGVDFLGNWLVLMSFASYLAMFDAGMNTVTSNEISILFARKDLEKCNILFNNNLFFIFFVFGIVFLLLLIVILVVDLSYSLGLNQFTESSLEYIVILLLVQVLAGVISGLFDSIYRATEKNATGIMINNLIKVLEAFLLIIGVVLHFDIITIVILLVIPTIVGLIFKAIHVQFFFTLSVSIKNLDKIEFKRVLKLAFSFLSIPIGHNVILLGIPLIINFMLGSALVVSYNTLRTLINFTKVSSEVITRSFWPEFSMAYGRRNFTDLKNLHRLCFSNSFFLTLIICIFYFLFGKDIYSIWTKGVLNFDMLLFFLFLLTLTTNSIWYSSFVLLQAVNRHKTISYFYLASSIISFFIAYLVIKMSGKISYLPLSFLFTDLVCGYLALKSVFFIVGDSFENLLRKLIEYPGLFFKKLLLKF